jgi:hypothetical protein
MRNFITFPCSDKIHIFSSFHKPIFPYKKHKDLNSAIEYLKNKYNKEEINIINHD